MYVEDLSDAAPTAFEDGSFNLFITCNESIEHAFAYVNSKNQTNVCYFIPIIFLVIIQFFVAHVAEY